MKEEKSLKILLKNPEAQALLEQKTVIINGIEINLWTGHTIDTVSAQNTWNKIISYTKLNAKASGTNGSIVFTGIMQIPREEACQYAIKLGFFVHSSVSKNTDFLVFGDSNVSPSKVAKALKINEEGGHVEFVDELTFLQLVLDNIDLDYVDYNSTKKDEIIYPPIKKVKLAKSNIDNSIEIISSKLSGLTFVISGVFDKYSRDELKQMIEENGGKNSGSISAKTNYVLAGDNMGPAKLEKAQKLKVQIISEDEFLGMILK